MGTNKPNPSPREIILEQNKRLSHSILWDLQMAAYCQFGPQAWAGQGVPFYPTSNPYIARQYAQVAAGYLRDCLCPGAPTPIDPAQPLYILDLGAGSGRFGYLFLKNLMEVTASLRLNLKIRYIMTDIASANIEFWRTHPYLQRYIDRGMLDFAFYHHAEQSGSLSLILSGETLSADTLVNPLILIGNYFFDTIPQDLFMAKDGKILEGRVTLSVEENEQTKKLSHTDPAIINHLKTHFDYVPIADVDHYYPDSPELNTILRSYAQMFDNIPILFPEGAFKSIKYFSALSKGRFLLLAGDQGRCTEKQLEDLKNPYIAKHGSFSIPVNYHAIAKYFRSQGGVSLLTTHPQPIFIVTASIMGGSLDAFMETNFAFRSHVDFFEPNEYFLLLDYTEKEWATPNLDTILLLIKLGNWDPINCHLFFERILKALPKAEAQMKIKLGETIHRVWENFFPVTKEEAGFIMNLGVLFFGMQRYQEALLYFERAAAIKGDDPVIFQNMAVCYDNLGDGDAAKTYKQKATALKKM